MKKLVKIFFGILFILSYMGISGCSDLVTDPNVRIDHSKNEGFVALSGVCKGGAVYAILDYESAEHFDPKLSSLVGVGFSCNKPVRYHLLKLTSGKYEFYNVNIDNNYYINNMKPIYFNVHPGKVTYLGRIHVLLNFPDTTFLQDLIGGGEPDTIRLGVADESKADIPVFLNRYKNIPENSYMTEILGQDK